MLKVFKPHKEPVRWGILHGLIAGITSALVLTVNHYVQHKEFAWVGIISGTTVFIVSVGTGFLVRWYLKKELKRKRGKNSK